MASSARPIEPPIANAVVATPDARPEYSSRTPRFAVIVVDTKEQPMPLAHSNDGRRTSVAQAPRASLPANSNIPTPRSVIPAARTRPGRSRAARRLAACVKMTIVSDIGASVSPA